MNVNWAFAKHDIHVFTFDELPIRLIMLCLLGLLGVGVIAERWTSKAVTPPQEQLTK